MKKYSVGYVAGVFDLFHVGHLNLIERAKEKCDYLIVGVLTDDLVLKNKNKLPYIPFRERLRIVGALKSVDRAVGIDESNIQKMDAWKQFHFDCLFSGDDYSGNKYWIEDKSALNAVGSNIEFFPYTKSTSSTQIREAMGVTPPQIPVKRGNTESPVAGNQEYGEREKRMMNEDGSLRIWAYRGCSYAYPENTLLAFRKASELRNLTGIETDIQLTGDGRMVVIHDESIDRTTDGHGCVKDYSLDDLRRFNISTDDPESPEHIPTIEEVFDLLEEPFKRGLLLNIELKNSYFSYEGMEEKILKLVEERELNENIVYSSFSIKSMAWIKQLNPKAHTGILGGAVSDLYWKYKNFCNAEALHPIVNGMDVEPRLLRESGMPVRAWMRAPLFTDRNTHPNVDYENEKCDKNIKDEYASIETVREFRKKGITDIFVNEPERYLEFVNL